MIVFLTTMHLQKKPISLKKKFDESVKLLNSTKSLLLCMPVFRILWDKMENPDNEPFCLIPKFMKSTPSRLSCELN